MEVKRSLSFIENSLTHSKSNPTLSTLIAVLFSCVLVACGGSSSSGGGNNPIGIGEETNSTIPEIPNPESPGIDVEASSQILTGTFAVGRPIEGVITVIGGNGAVAFATSLPDGNFAVNLDGLTHPISVRGQSLDNSVVLYSYANSAEELNLNINQLTDKVVRDTGLFDPSRIFDAEASSVDIPQDVIDQVENDLKNNLVVQISYSGLDSQTLKLFSDPVVANGIGYDAILDLTPDLSALLEFNAEDVDQAIRTRDILSKFLISRDDGAVVVNTELITNELMSGFFDELADELITSSVLRELPLSQTGATRLFFVDSGRNAVTSVVFDASRELIIDVFADVVGLNEADRRFIQAVAAIPAQANILNALVLIHQGLKGEADSSFSDSLVAAMEDSFLGPSRTVDTARRINAALIDGPFELFSCAFGVEAESTQCRFRDFDEPEDVKTELFQGQIVPISNSVPPFSLASVTPAPGELSPSWIADDRGVRLVFSGAVHRGDTNSFTGRNKLEIKLRDVALRRDINCEELTFLSDVEVLCVLPEFALVRNKQYRFTVNASASETIEDTWGVSAAISYSTSGWLSDAPQIEPESGEYDEPVLITRPEPPDSTFFLRFTRDGRDPTSQNSEFLFSSSELLIEESGALAFAYFSQGERVSPVSRRFYTFSSATNAGNTTDSGGATDTTGSGESTNDQTGTDGGVDAPILFQPSATPVITDATNGWRTRTLILTGTNAVGTAGFWHEQLLEIDVTPAGRVGFISRLRNTADDQIISAWSGDVNGSRLVYQVGDAVAGLSADLEVSGIDNLRTAEDGSIYLVANLVERGTNLWASNSLLRITESGASLLIRAGNVLNQSMPYEIDVSGIVNYQISLAGVLVRLDAAISAPGNRSFNAQALVKIIGGRTTSLVLADDGLTRPDNDAFLQARNCRISLRNFSNSSLHTARMDDEGNVYFNAILENLVIAGSAAQNCAAVNSETVVRVDTNNNAQILFFDSNIQFDNAQTILSMIGIADNGNLILASTVSRFDDVLWEFDTTNNQLNLIRVNNETVLPESLDLESYRNPGFDDPKAGSNYKHTSNGDISISLASPFRVILLGRARQGNPYTDSSVLGTSAIRAVVAARPLGVDDLITFDAIGFDHAIDDDLNIILYGRNPQSIDSNNAGIFLISPDGSIDKILDQDAVVETSGNINPRLTDSVSILAPGSDVAGSTTFFTPFNDAGFLMQTRMGLFLLTR